MYRWFWFLVQRRSGLIHPRREWRFLKLSVTRTWQLRRAYCRKAFRAFLKDFREVLYISTSNSPAAR